MNLRLLALALLAISAGNALAHPGHHPMEYGLGHLLTTPYHLIVLTAFGIALYGVARLVKHRAASRLLSVAGFLAIGAAGAIWLMRA